MLCVCKLDHKYNYVLDKCMNIFYAYMYVQRFIIISLWCKTVNLLMILKYIILHIFTKIFYECPLNVVQTLIISIWVVAFLLLWFVNCFQRQIAVSMIKWSHLLLMSWLSVVYVRYEFDWFIELKRITSLNIIKQLTKLFCMNSVA